jgi:hypothetical protein
MLIVTLSAALMLLSIAPQAGAAKSQLKCGGDNLQCGSLAAQSGHFETEFYCPLSG